MSKNKIIQSALVAILAFSTYHTVRDILQIYGAHNIFADWLHWEHRWCKPYCDYVLFPPELFNIAAIGIILKRGKLGILGILVFATIPYLFYAWLAK